MCSDLRVPHHPYDCQNLLSHFSRKPNGLPDLTESSGVVAAGVDLVLDLGIWVSGDHVACSMFLSCGSTRRLVRAETIQIISSNLHVG